ncbi:pilin [Candidatus Parcubacteria bacterium]|nr:pilin [Candidatus Parcubacteria bacterium]
MKKFLLAATWALPAFVFAQSIDTTSLNDSIQALIRTVNLVVPLLLAVAVVVFIWGVIVYILAQGDIERKKAVGRIVYSVIAIAAILAVWGLARLLIDVFGLDTGGPAGGDLPTIPSSGIPNSGR